MNIYIIGVGGQGIGLLSEVILRAIDHAGIKVTGVDTHGLAQRGGIVVSQIRYGEDVYSPLIGKAEADIVIALERNEAYRAMNDMLRDGGTLIYYNALWQPLEVRVAQSQEVSEQVLNTQCQKRGIKVYTVFNKELKNAQMQNIVLLGNMSRNSLIPEVKNDHYIKAMEDLMEGTMLEKNRDLFIKESKSS